MKFCKSVGTLGSFQPLCPIVCITLCYEHLLLSLQVVEKTTKVDSLWDPIFRSEHSKVLRHLPVQFIPYHLLKFSWVPFADIHVRSLAVKQNAEFTEGGFSAFVGQSSRNSGRLGTL